MIRTSQALVEAEKTKSGVWNTHAVGRALSGFAKRIFDFVAALTGLIVLLPVFVLIAVLIKRDSPGPVFYWGRRIGRYGSIFRMLKFRTMYEDPRSYHGPRVTCREDDRITPLGKWLRATKLNELPQLWNVLVGEMSLVGPRPEDPAIGKTWPAAIARVVLSVRPGITSPASVLYRDEEIMLPAAEVMRKYLHELSPDKLRLDQLYVRYRSFWLDLDIILWTFLLLIPRIRSYSLPEHHLFVGPLTKLTQRYLSWFLWDFLVVLLSMGVAGVAVRLFGPLDLGWPRSIEMALAFSALYSLVGIILGISRIDWRKATFWEAGRLWASWLVVTLAWFGFQYYAGGAGFRAYGLILVAALLSLAGIIFVRYQDRLLNGFFSRLAAGRPNTNATRERVMIVGSGRTAEHIAWLMDHPTYSGKFRIIGFIDDDLRSQGMKIYGSKVIGRIVDIQRIIKEHDVGLIILADSQMAARKFKEFREIARFNPARVVVAPDIFGSLGGLDATSRDVSTGGELDAFQCQHCLARYSEPPPALRPAALKKGVRKPLTGQPQVSRRRNTWKNSRQGRKP